MANARSVHVAQSIIVRDKPTCNIIIAGESGTGKTAVTNMLFGNVNLKTSSSALGCTNESQSVRRAPKDYGDMNLRIVDTVGLGESSEGAVPNEDALTMLEDKLNSLHDKDGIHLILFCIRKGRQTEATALNYQAIVHELCENKVPCVLVITRCEDDEPLGEWWDENKDVLRNRFKLDVKDAVAVTTINNEETAEDYKESRKRLIDSIKKNALQEPWETKGFSEKIRTFFYKQTNRSKILREPKTDFDKYLQRPMSEPKASSSSIFSRWFSSN